MAQRIVIVGSAACGPKLACRLKRLEHSAEITILERGRDISYGACGMPYLISGVVDRLEAFFETPVGVLREVGFFEKMKGLETLCQREAVAIDRGEKGFENVSFIEGGPVGWPFELRTGS